MAILADANTSVLVQGITGREGRFHTQLMLDYGTNVVGGVRPGKGGEWISGKPIFDSVHAAIQATEATASIIFAPPQAASDAIIEAAAARIKLIVCITEGIPVLDVMKVIDYVRRSKSILIGPNCPGILIPRQTNLGIIPPSIARPGTIGVVSRSGALTYEVVHAISNAGLGQSAIIGIGGDIIVGTSYVDILERFENDPKTDKVVLLGEIGGRAEIDAASYIASHMTKPVVAFIAGQSAPENRRMGHAGAIIEGGTGTAIEKIEALQAAGVRIAQTPDDIPGLLM